MDTVSIVLPCYNHGNFVLDAIQSVLDQTYTNFELFVFDNGSKDDSWEKINRFEDERIIKVRLKRNDLLAVKNRFCKMAKGKYFAIMHADDIWDKNKIEKQIEFLRSAKDARVCTTWGKRIEIDEDYKEIESQTKLLCWGNASVKEWYRKLLTEENLIILSSLVCDRDIYKKYFNRMIPYRQVGDVYTWLKILEETNIYAIEEELVIKRNQNTSDSQNESYPTHVNLARSVLEARNAKYRIVDEMPDELFLKYFDEAQNTDAGHMDVMCKKFLFMEKNGTEMFHGYEDAIRYYDTYFDYKENGQMFYSYLMEKYGFSIKKFYELEAEAVMGDAKNESRIQRGYLLENTDMATVDYPAAPVSIYGCGWAGKALCRRIWQYCKIEQFIDRSPKEDNYRGIKITSINKAHLDDNSVVIVVPTYDFARIKKDLMERHRHLNVKNIIRFEDFMKTGRLIEPYL